MSLSLRPPALFSLVLALFAATISLPAQAPVALDGAPFSLTAAQLAAASGATPATPMTDVTVLYEETSYRIAPDRAMTYAHHIIYRLETQAGVQGWSETSMQWDPWLENQAQLRARVLPAGGAFLELDPKTITDAPVSGNDDETYSNSRVRKAPLPGVAVGAIVEEFVSTEEKQPFFTAGGVYRDYFARRVPVLREKLIVELPSTMPFHHKESYLPSVAVTDEQHDGLRRLVFDQGPLAPRVASDINLTSADVRAPLVEFSTGESWHSVASAYAALSDSQIVTSEVMSLLPSPMPSDRMKTIQALVQRLHHDVRYTGIEFGESRLTPQHPAEVLARRYGDCKDKATLLVAMLRASNIPANLALLEAGAGRDVNPDLPGMNQFNHAIVYVPAAGAQPALWIDATANFSEVGTLPYGDRARSALIIAPETQQLTSTPAPAAQDSSLIETRTFTLSENGPSHVVEISETHGDIDANYRSAYGGAETRKVRDELEGYAQRAYLAKALAHIDHPDGADLAKPFSLTLDMTGARRGYSSLTDSVVAIFPYSPLGNLPSWFSTAPPVLGPDATAEQRKDLDLARQQRSSEYLLMPQTFEQRYRILVSSSFVLRSLPADKTTQLGPATLTESYRSAEPGVVTATLRFVQDKPVLTAQEALDLRQAVLDVHKRDTTMIYFDQVGAKLFAAGKIREGLDADKSAIQQHPKEAVHHLRLANALLQAGIGTQAHEEARRATQLDPTSAIAFSTLGWTLEHNDIGVRFGNGYDRDGAIAAYRKAQTLDPEDNDLRFDLAILYEFDAKGVRYTAAASLPDAIAEYRALIDKNKDTDTQTTAQYKDNLLFALLYAHQYDEVLKLTQQLPATVSRNSAAIAATIAQKDLAAGTTLADHFGGSAETRNSTLREAGTLLSQLRLYSKAAAALSAGMQGDSNAATAARQIEMFRNLQPASADLLPASDPRQPVQALMTATVTDNLTREKVASLLSRHPFATDDEWKRNLDHSTQSTGFFRAVAEKASLSPAILQDLILGTLKITPTGDDETGHPIVAQTMGASSQSFFVAKEGGVYKIIADESDTNIIGTYVLYLLDQNKPAAAKAILDWKRDQLHKEGGDDSLSGTLLTRFWSAGDAADPEALRLAAASLLASSADIKPLLPRITALRDKAPAAKLPSDERTRLDLILAQGYAAVGDGPNALAAAQELLAVQSDSNTALTFAGVALVLKGDPASWNTLIDPLLAKHPQDPELLRQRARASEVLKDYAGARKALRSLLDGGKANANDYNNYAWLSLFDNKLDDDTAQAAQQSNMLSSNKSFAAMHTLASIYAAEGKVTEARKVLEDAMYVGSIAQPNPACWYVLGLIYEQYGMNDAAIEAFSHVEAGDNPATERLDTLSTYGLAQDQIKKLKASAPPPASSTAKT